MENLCRKQDLSFMTVNKVHSIVRSAFWPLLTDTVRTVITRVYGTQEWRITSLLRMYYTYYVIQKCAKVSLRYTILWQVGVKPTVGIHSAIAATVIAILAPQDVP